MDEFLEKYPALNNCSVVEQERLRYTANWMDLSFYSIQPRNNKTFILSLIPRIVEGRNARYITGSGQTRQTADRVDLFRLEGCCEKIKRPPRRKKEPVVGDDDTKSGGTATTPQPAITEPDANANLEVKPSIPSSASTSNMFAPMMFPYYPRTILSVCFCLD
jgi:hypothetical protein